MSTFTNTAREVEMPNGDIVKLHDGVTPNSTSNIKKFKYDDNGHVTESTAADAEDLNLSGYSTPTTGTTDIGASDDVQTAIGKLDHQSHIDQTNILYAINTGVKNIIDFSTGEITPSVTTHSVTWTIADNKGAVANGTSDSSGSYPIMTKLTLPVGTYKMSGGTSRIKFQCGNIVDSGSGATFTVNENTTQPVSFIVYATPNTTFSNETIYPMLCTEEAWNQSHDYQPPALPNYDLTRLESEDRASLAEVVDSGAKNLINCSVDNIKSLNSKSTYSWNGNTVTAYGRTATVNSDGTITVAAGTGSAEFWLKVANYTYASGVSYVLSGCPANGSTTTYYMESDNLNLRDLGSGVVINSATTDELYVVVKTTGSTPALTFKPMLCTKAAFGVSQKFVPYKTTFDNNMTKVATWLTSFSIPATAGTLKYLYVRGGSPTKMGVYLLANPGIITEVAAFSYGTFTITYNSNNNSFDCTSSATVEAYIQTYPIP